MERKLNVLPVRTFLSRGVTGVKCAHAPHFQPNCHFPQNFAFRRNKVASDFRTQRERESDLGPLSGSGLWQEGLSLQNAHRQQLLTHRRERKNTRSKKDKVSFLVASQALFLPELVILFLVGRFSLETWT